MRRAGASDQMRDDGEPWIGAIRLAFVLQSDTEAKVTINQMVQVKNLPNGTWVSMNR